MSETKSYTLQVVEVRDGDKVVAVEFTNGVENWFYDFNQDRFPSMRIGKVPRKNLNEDYERHVVYERSQ
jgi:hypothetical protein